jgi:potassium-dependent mechanosensitive channel
VLAGIVVAILLTPLGGQHPDGITPPQWLKVLRLPVWATIVAIAVSTLAGYIALARFLAQQLVVTGSILAIVYLLLLWVDGFTQGLSDGHAAIGRWLQDSAGLDQRRREQLALPFGLFLKFTVLVLSVPLIILQWGYNWPDIFDWYRQLFWISYRQYPSLVCRAVGLDHRIRAGLFGGAAVSELARRARSPAGWDFGRCSRFDSHRRRLRGDRPRSHSGGFLCGL